MEISGTELRASRVGMGLSQAKLSQLTALPQSLLSAFELGKIELSIEHKALLKRVLSDSTQVGQIIARPKRFRAHKYVTPQTIPERLARAQRTLGNADYLATLRSLSEAHAAPRAQGAPTAVSLFSGCGGFSLGFSAAGFNVRGYLELSDDFRNIYRANFKSSVELGGDILEVSDLALRSFHHDKGEIDVIIGGPPCQGFSLSGKREVNDPRNALFHEYLRVVRELRPKVAVLENVRLLTSMKSPSGSYVKDDITAAFVAEGYSTDFFEINAKDYGVPQHRERVIFMAVRSDLRHRPSLPMPSHRENGSVGLFAPTLPWRSFADAVSDLSYLESGEASATDPLHQAVRHPAHVIDWLWDVPEGKSAHDNADPSKRPPSGYNTTYKRQVWLEPAGTVQTTSGMISGCRNVHPIATRSLTIREAARLQSFPDEFYFPPSGVARAAIGNAVPPLLARVIAEHVNALLKDQIL
jgi:DNA (cytosine-5)-methyltransferase 1